MINNAKDWEALKQQIQAANVISFDLETDGLFGTILCFSVCLEPEVANVVPVFHKDSLLDGKEILAFLKKNLLEREVVLVGQNLAYDLVCLAQSTGGMFDMKCRVEDCMAYDFMLDENVLHRDLDTLVKKYTKYESHKEEIDRTKIAQYDMEEVEHYSKMDAIVPPTIIKKIRRKLEAKGHRSPYMEEFYRRVVPFCAALRGFGMKIDTKILREEHDKEIKVNEELLAKAESYNDEINLKSWQQLSKFIYEDLGCEIPDIKDVLAKNGLPKTNDNVLSAIPNKHEFIDILLEYRKSNRQLSHYFEKTWEFLKPDGFVYPEFFVIKSLFGGTVSGRLSAKNPAVQTFPKTEIRNAYISRYGDEGTLVSIDGAQMELRYAAILSGDATLIETFVSGKDPHQATADLIAQPRSVGKMVNFAGVYGVTWQGLVEKAGLDKKTAIYVAGRLKEAWSGLYEFLEGVKFFIIHNQVVNTPYGRWRRLPGASIYDPIGRFKIREGQNFVIQSVASDIVQLLGWDLWQELHPIAVPIMSNHDGLLFDVPTQHLEVMLDKMKQRVVQLPELLKEVLNIDVTVPFVFDVNVGKNWLEVEKETLVSFKTKSRSLVTNND